MMPVLSSRPANEEARQNALRDLNLLDTPPSESFDRLTRLASKLLGAPVSTISLTDHDRQWFKSRVGVDISEIPRDHAPCNYAIRGNEVLVINDLAEDPRFADSPLVQSGIRFYAGAPLYTRSGHGIGTLCIVDGVVRDLDDDQRKLLRDLAAMVMAQVDLHNMIGRIDSTTGLPNQHQMFEDLEEIARLEPMQLCAAVLLDVDPTRTVVHGQRVMGIDYSEAMMRGTIAALRPRLPMARIYQVKPTQLAIIEDSDDGNSDDMVATIRQALTRPIHFRGVPIMLHPAMGTLEFLAGDVAPRDVLRRLINAVEDALETESRFARYSAGRDLRHAHAFMLLSDFSVALDSPDQLSLAYQPRIDMASGLCTGVEALIRWNHPLLGNVPPNDFIAAVEQTALARRLTDWVLRAAIRQLSAWRKAGIDIEVSVNVCAQNLDEPDFATRVLALLSEHHVAPSSLELEFTERSMARDNEHVIAQLTELRDHGLNIAIDDFGTGCSNLAYLQQLPSSVLKIDRAFVSGIADSTRDQALVRAIITMAHDLGYRVVAEGIETAPVYDLLQTWGCEQGQGYLMAQPMPVGALEAWLVERGSVRLSA